MECRMGELRTSVGTLTCFILVVCGVVLIPGRAEGRLVTGFAPCPQTNPPAAECIVSLLVDLRPFRIKGSKAATLPQAPSTSVSTTSSPPTTTNSLPVTTSAPIRPTPSTTDEEVQMQLIHQQRRYEMQLREQQRHQQVLERQLRQQGEELRFLKEQVRQLLQLLGTKAALDVPQRADETNWDRSSS